MQWRPGGGESRVACFFFGTDLTPPGVRVLARATEPQIFSVSESLHFSSDGHPTVVRSPGGFRSFPDHAREGGCLNYFPFYLDATARSDSFEQYVTEQHFPEHVEASLSSLAVA